MSSSSNTIIDRGILSWFNDFDVILSDNYSAKKIESLSACGLLLRVSICTSKNPTISTGIEGKVYLNDSELSTKSSLSKISNKIDDMLKKNNYQRRKDSTKSFLPFKTRAINQSLTQYIKH